MKQSERVRGIILERYLRPALRSGKKRFSVSAQEVLRDAEATPEFPRGRTPMICKVLTSQKLLEGTGLTIEGVDGPPSLQSRTVVVHYRLIDGVSAASVMSEAMAKEKTDRFIERFCELMGPGVAAHGGAKAFVNWLRPDEDGR